MLWYGMLCYGMYGKVWCGMLWYDMTWCGMVSYGMRWYGTV